MNQDARSTTIHSYHQHVANKPCILTSLPCSLVLLFFSLFHQPDVFQLQPWLLSVLHLSRKNLHLFH